MKISKGNQILLLTIALIAIAFIIAFMTGPIFKYSLLAGSFLLMVIMKLLIKFYPPKKNQVKNE